LPALLRVPARCIWSCRARMKQSPLSYPPEQAPDGDRIAYFEIARNDCHVFFDTGSSSRTGVENRVTGARAPVTRVIGIIIPVTVFRTWGRDLVDDTIQKHLTFLKVVWRQDSYSPKADTLHQAILSGFGPLTNGLSRT
jgi:hypothetical protein